ncbi:hypothetical protein MRX96_030155 [Rhipicephalus microplus]
MVGASLSLEQTGHLDLEHLRLSVGAAPAVCISMEVQESVLKWSESRVDSGEPDSWPLDSSWSPSELVLLVSSPRFGACVQGSGGSLIRCGRLPSLGVLRNSSGPGHSLSCGAESWVLGPAALMSVQSRSGSTGTCYFSYFIAPQPSVCFRCGSPRHWANFLGCPARRRTCKSSGKQVHFSKMCRSSGDSVSATDGEEGQGRTVTNAITVLTVKAAVNGVQLMRVPVLINGVQIKLLVDTVAIVSLPSIQDYQKPFSNVKLLQSHLTIHNHSQQALQLAIIGETLSCTVIQPDPRRVQKSVHRRNLQAGHEDSAKIQQRSFRLPKEVTDDLAWLEEVGLLKKVR